MKVQLAAKGWAGGALNLQRADLMALGISGEAAGSQVVTYHETEYLLSTLLGGIILSHLMG